MTFDTRTWLHQHEHESTLLGVCPMSEEIVTATLREAATEDGFVPMFIATPRQVDADRGYTGWSQNDLIDHIETTATAVGYDGEYIVARDHGGPYQSTRDRGQPDVPLDEAMEYAKELFARDVRAGFDVLHVDATEDPRLDGILELEEVARRTAALIASIEEVREAEGAPPVYYEVGTEEIEGGMTNPEDFERFISTLNTELSAIDFDVTDRILFIVGQVGTTMQISRENDFDAPQARELLDITADHELSLKVHYTDWLPRATLARFPELGIGAANVGPEFAAAIVEGLETLEEHERRAIEGTTATPAKFMETIGRAAVEDAPWQKFTPPELPETEYQSFADNHRRDIAVCVGRYVLNRPDVAAARDRLYANLRAHGDIDEPHEHVVASVQDTIHRYVDAFNLQ